jgi:hypothetical protein
MFGGSHSHSGGSGGSHSHSGGGASPDPVGFIFLAVGSFAVLGGLIGAEWIGQHVYKALYPGVQITRIAGGQSVSGSWGWCFAVLGFALVCAALGILLCFVAVVRRGGWGLAGGLIAIALAAVLGLIVTPYLASNAKRADAVASAPAAVASGGRKSVAAGQPPRPPANEAPTSKPWTSPVSFPITYPEDMTVACAQQDGQGSTAELTSTSVPSYDVVCVNGGAANSLDLDAFCPWLAQDEHYKSPNGRDGWWSGNPERFDSSTSDQPWTDWRCYNTENRP